MPVALLLAMQAAGMITDLIGTRNQANLMNLGMKVQQAGIEANIEQNKLETADASLQAMKQLRQSLGTQIAVYAARGTSTAAGSAATTLNESFTNFNADERMRRLNALGKETGMRGQGLISRLQNSADINNLWKGFATRTFNRFSTNPSAYSSMFGSTGG